MKKVATGIYAIINKVNGKIYIGSTGRDFVKRWREHKIELRNGSHYNQYVQNAWDKHGEKNFVFEIIETVDCKNKEFILEREQYWMDYFKSNVKKSGYNILPTAGSCLGYRWDKTKKHPLFGYKQSISHRKNLGKVRKGMHAGEKHPGVILTWEKVREIREKYISRKYVQRELAEMYGVSISAIAHIVHNRCWVEASEDKIK